MFESRIGNIYEGAFLTLRYPNGTEEDFFLDSAKSIKCISNNTWRFLGVPSSLRPETFTFEISRHDWPELFKSDYE